jgi:hypothetical protein
MSFLMPVNYHNKEYPDGIKPKIREVAAHFDVDTINKYSAFSMHTEYSFMGRKFNTCLIQKYNTIIKSNKKNVPQLWYSKEWSLEFFEFIKDLTEGSVNLKIVEIHPPFSDYSSTDKFLENFKYFEEKMQKYYPGVKILIENRSGTRYSGGKFIISDISQITDLSKRMDGLNSNLKITLDIPQLFTTHKISKRNIKIMPQLFEEIKSIRHNIAGIHLWGKRISAKGRRVAHVGDLNSYFLEDTEVKKMFLNEMHNTFNDDIKRYFVPEVNSSSEDLKSIVNDLKNAGFVFI